MSDSINRTKTTGGFLSRSEADLLLGWAGHAGIEAIHGLSELMSALRAEPNADDETISLTPELSTVGRHFASFALRQELDFVQGLANNGMVDAAVRRLEAGPPVLLGIFAKLGEVPYTEGVFSNRTSIDI